MKEIEETDKEALREEIPVFSSVKMRSCPLGDLCPHGEACPFIAGTGIPGEIALFKAQFDISEEDFLEGREDLMKSIEGIGKVITNLSNGIKKMRFSETRPKRIRHEMKGKKFDKRRLEF